MLSVSRMLDYTPPMPSSVSTSRPAVTAPPSSDAPAPDAEYSLQTQGQLEPHLHQEWLLTNGLGGFASSSVVGCNTRRYHGLLVAATLPPVGRVMALNRVGEIVRV